MTRPRVASNSEVAQIDLRCLGTLPHNLLRLRTNVGVAFHNLVEKFALVIPVADFLPYVRLGLAKQCADQFPCLGRYRIDTLRRCAPDVPSLPLRDKLFDRFRLFLQRGVASADLIVENPLHTVGDNFLDGVRGELMQLHLKCPSAGATSRLLSDRDFEGLVEELVQLIVGNGVTSGSADAPSRRHNAPYRASSPKVKSQKCDQPRPRVGMPI